MTALQRLVVVVCLAPVVALALWSALEIARQTSHAPWAPLVALPFLVFGLGGLVAFGLTLFRGGWVPGERE